MKSHTDLKKIKDLAHALLELDIKLTKHSPLVVKHPFTDSGIVGIRGKDGHITVADLANNPEDVTAWRTQVTNQINDAKSAFEIYLMITKSYALGFLKYAAPNLSEEDFAGILADAWVSTEAPNSDPNLTKKDLLAMFKTTDPALLMDKDDYQAFQNLDETVTIYRGVTSMNAKNVKALSWTLDRDTAEWFAHRFGENGTVYEAKINKEHIYALFNGRNESEVIVDPKHLINITKTHMMTQEPQLTM